MYQISFKMSKNKRKIDTHNCANLSIKRQFIRNKMNIIDDKHNFNYDGAFVIPTPQNFNDEYGGAFVVIPTPQKHLLPNVLHYYP